MQMLFLGTVCCLLVNLTAASDASCTGKGGTCQEDSTTCHGTYYSNLCDGAATRRCCVPAPTNDAACASQHGTCQDDVHSTCAGSYVTGLCSGDAHRRCCVSSSTSHTTNPASCPHIISRAEWGARAPKSHISNMPAPAKYMFIHHGASAGCHDQATCMNILRQYQNYHMDGHGWLDIAYNFIVGEDGNAYMGRGWTEQGGHTLNYNSVGVAICMIGNFMDHAPNAAAIAKVKALIQCGLDLGHLQPTYTLKGHRDVGSTACPGTSYYNLIQSWPHYVAGTALWHA